MGVTLFDILGIDRDPSLDILQRSVIAAGMWPSRKLHFLPGDIDTDESVADLMKYLQLALQFKSITPGATADTVGFYADISILNPAIIEPLVIRTMPDVLFFLQDTKDSLPARCYVTKTSEGTEIVIESLPVEIRLPGGLIEPLTSPGVVPPNPLITFDAGLQDSFKVELRTSEASSIFVHIKVRVTQELDFIIEPAVVMSIGPCLFSGLPCLGLHDISLIAAPTLKGNHEKVEQAIEWTRHTIEPSESMLPGDTNFRGVVAIRTIDLDSAQSPMKELHALLNSGQPQPNTIQFVLEDIVIPFFSVMLLPLPIHGTLGIRRSIEFGNRFEETFSFAKAPVKIDLAGFIILIEEFIIQTVDPDAIEESQVARVQIAITQSPEVTFLTNAINASETSIQVDNLEMFKDVFIPNSFIIENNDPLRREIVIVNTPFVNPLTVVRGQHNIPASTHDAGATFQLNQFPENAVTLGFTEEWTAQAGWRRNTGIKLFTIGDNTVKLMGAKVGFSFKHLYEQTHGIADYSWDDFFQVLIDLNLELKPSTNKTFRIEALSNGLTFDGRNTTFATAIDNSTQAIQVLQAAIVDGLGLPKLFVINEEDPADREVVTVIARNGNQFDVVRGGKGTTAKAHAVGSTFSMEKSPENLETINIAWKDVGWNLGSLSFGAVKLPEGTQIVILNFLKIIIQEVSISTDKNGGTYFLVSGGISVDNAKYAAAILVYRFQWRIAGNENAPKWQLGGISFLLRIKTFEISGSGMAGEFIENEHLYKELQFSLNLKFEAFGKKFGLGIFLYKGEVSGPVDNFKYWMFGFSFAYLPLSSFDLYNIRMLAANNLAPNLAPPDASEQHLRVFKWYKNSTAPLSLPTDKKMNAWRPQADSFAFGVGAGASIGGTKTILLDLFVFYHDSPSENGLMVAMEVFLLKSQKAIGFGVVEIDFERGKWAFMLGVSLSFSNVLPEGVSPPGLDNVAALSGTLYLGNQPGTFALGQLSDQNTWLGFRMREDRFFKMELIIAICMQFVDREEGPKGFGAVISAKGTANFGVGTAEFYLNFLMMAGIWKNESSASGLILLFEAGFRIKLFRVFRFGASIKIQLDLLGPDPEYRRMAFEIHIETPWYLPDVTIRFDKVSSTPAPESQDMVSSPIISAESFVHGVKQPGKVLLTGLESVTVDEKQLFDLDRLRQLVPQSLSQNALNEMIAIGVDSTIVLNFKPPVDDKLTIGEITPPGAGTQAAVAPASSELSITYELISLSIRRQPLYGPDAHQWTTLLAPENTQMPALEDWPSDAELDVLFSSEIKVKWDKDVQSQGRLDPRRLLINAETPFTLLTQNNEADEATLIHQPGWPCCGAFDTGGKEQWHRITYKQSEIGTRVHGYQFFSDSQSTVHWLLHPKPFVGPAMIAPGNSAAAKLNLYQPREFTFAVIHFDEPAFHFRMYCFWLPQHRHASIIIDAYNGVDLIKEIEFPLTIAQNGVLETQHPQGMTRIVFRFVSEDDFTGIVIGPGKTEIIEVVRLEYRTVAEQLGTLSNPEKCHGGETSSISGKGKLAWLPNHNYEITATTKVILHHNQSGSQEAEMVQRAYFRTKGMIGLNYVEHNGKEIEPYVEAIFPKHDTFIIYREEPIALAFKEQFNILMPVDRNLDPANAAELNQVLEWDLTVDKQGDPTGRNRISKSNNDWIVEHRGSGNTNPFDFTVLIADVMLLLTRQAKTTDPMRLRVGNLLASPYSCSGGSALPPPPSQVLLHKPVDPSKESTSTLWSSNTAFRANLKAKGGPCIHRNPFDAADVSAFKPFTEAGFASGSWVFENGGIQLGPATDPGLRYYAVFGEADWNHVQINVQVNPGGLVTGFAIGVQSSTSGIEQAMMALIDETSGFLKVMKLSAGQMTMLQQVAIPGNNHAPYQLDIIAYDDQLEVRLDDAFLVVQRNEIRSGQLALVGKGGGAFTRLTVEALDAYRFFFQSSRFVSFETHIQSAGNKMAVIPAGFAAQDEVIIIDELYAATSTDIIRLMKTGADAALRQNIFMQWAEALVLPLVQNPSGLVISRLQKDEQALVVLLESPEPLHFISELTLTVTKEVTVIDPLPVPAGLGALASVIPASLQGLQSRLEEIRGIEEVDIQSNGITFVTRNLVQHFVQQPHFGLVAISHEGQLKYFLFELTFMPLGQNRVRIMGRLRSRRSFNLFQFLLTRAIGRQMRDIRANQIFLLTAQGELIQEVPLPDLSMPFFAPQHFQLISNGNETRTLLIPLDGLNGSPMSWTAGKYRFRFILNRVRYVQELPDDNAVYAREVEVEIGV